MYLLGSLLLGTLIVPTIGLGEPTSLGMRVVDMARVLQESATGKRARDQLERELSPARKKVEQLKQEVEQLQSELRKQAALLHGAALEKKQVSLENKRKDFQRAAQDLREEGVRRNKLVLGKVITAIREISSELGQAKGYEVLVEKDERVIIYNSSRVDVTDEVIKSLDSKSLSF